MADPWAARSQAFGTPRSLRHCHSLTRMIDWVSWPLGKNIDKWIIALLKGLAAVKKFSILIGSHKVRRLVGSCTACKVFYH